MSSDRCAGFFAVQVGTSATVHDTLAEALVRLVPCAAIVRFETRDEAEAWAKLAPRRPAPATEASEGAPTAPGSPAEERNAVAAEEEAQAEVIGAFAHHVSDDGAVGVGAVLERRADGFSWRGYRHCAGTVATAATAVSQEESEEEDATQAVARAGSGTALRGGGAGGGGGGSSCGGAGAGAPSEGEEEASSTVETEVEAFLLLAEAASVLAPRESLLLLGGSRLLHSLLRRRVAAPTLADGARVLAAGGVICAAEALTLRRGGALSTLLSRGAALLAGLDRCALLVETAAAETAAAAAETAAAETAAAAIEHPAAPSSPRGCGGGGSAGAAVGRRQLAQLRGLAAEARVEAARASLLRASGSELLAAPLAAFPPLAAPLAPAPMAGPGTAAATGSRAAVLAADPAAAEAGAELAPSACLPSSGEAPPGTSSRASSGLSAGGGGGGGGSGWSCEACTYRHDTPREASFLSCFMCGHPRPAAKKRRGLSGGGGAAKTAATAQEGPPKRRRPPLQPRNGHAVEAADAAPEAASSGRLLLPYEEREVLSQIEFAQREAARVAAGGTPPGEAARSAPAVIDLSGDSSPHRGESKPAASQPKVAAEARDEARDEAPPTPPPRTATPPMWRLEAGPRRVPTTARRRSSRRGSRRSSRRRAAGGERTSTSGLPRQSSARSSLTSTSGASSPSRAGRGAISSTRARAASASRT